jgi:hypothetical protein
VTGWDAAPSAARGEQPLPHLIACYSREREVLVRALRSATRVAFVAGWRCERGQPADGHARAVQLHPPDRLLVGRLELGLTGRALRVRSHMLRWRARRAWSRGSILLVGHRAWIPADCWTPRVFAEAGMRLYMRLCDGERPHPPLPDFELPNRWFDAGTDAASQIAVAVARMREAAEDEAFARWPLEAAGRLRFERFGRDPSQPLR